jgi:hypothetical protein
MKCDRVSEPEVYRVRVFQKINDPKPVIAIATLREREARSLLLRFGVRRTSSQ